MSPEIARSDAEKLERRAFLRFERWLDQLEWETEPSRKKRAVELRRRGQEKYDEAIAEGKSPAEARGRALWFWRRARGQLLRFDRARECGSEVVQIACDACGFRHEVTQGCRLQMLCARCRGSVVSVKRAQMLASRNVVVAEAERDGLLKERRRGGRFTEKLMTLTVPHLGNETINTRAGRLREAWVKFIRKLKCDLQERGAWGRVHYFRVVEWTPGSDPVGDPAGHPHIHVWMFSPFLEQDAVTEMWTSSIEFEEVPEGIRFLKVDLRVVHNGPKAAREVIKYLFKDLDHLGRRVSPEVYAAVCAAFEGTRSTQCSKGFKAKAGERVTCACGTSLPRRIEIKKKREAEKERVRDAAIAALEKEMVLL